jgi:hypothetical protein
MAKDCPPGLLSDASALGQIPTVMDVSALREYLNSQVH